MARQSERPARQAGPLAGIVVLDLTRYLPGALTTLWLARCGAEVLKIERPGLGDPGRQRKQLFEASNAGKKSLALDLKSAAGKRLFKRLAADADVLVENFRPGVLKRLGLEYSSLANRRLIYASLAGYAAGSESAGAAGHDINYSAETGLLDLISPAGTHLPELPIADVAGGTLPLLVGILLALVERSVTGRGRRVEVAIQTGLSSLLAWPRTAGPGRTDGAGDGNLLDGSYACYGVYYAKCGKRLAVGALEPKFWANLCRELGCEDLIPEQFAAAARQGQIKRRIAEGFRARSSQQWLQRLRGRDCCVSPVRTFAEARGEQGLAALGVSLADMPGREGEGAPALGEDSAEILGRVGMSQEQLGPLVTAGVVELAQNRYHRDA